jgi:predicted ester cyclase
MLCAPDFAFYSQSQVTEPSSLEETVDGFKTAFKAFPDFNWIINDLIAAGDKIIARFSITGTLSGESLGIPAIGNKIKTSAIGIWHMKDGKCVEVRLIDDRLTMMEQLGMELKPDRLTMMEQLGMELKPKEGEK